MNIKRHALSGFSHTLDSELLVRGYTVAKAMENNSFFPDAAPSLAELKTQLQQFEQKLALALKTRSVLDAAIKNDFRPIVEATLKQLAFYVNSIAKGELEYLHSSGFELSKSAGRGVSPDIVSNVRFREGKQSGSLHLNFDNQALVPLYEYRYAHEKDEVGSFIWCEPFITSTTRNVISFLTPFKPYYFQVRALNGYGRSEWSEPVCYVCR